MRKPISDFLAERYAGNAYCAAMDAEQLVMIVTRLFAIAIAFLAASHLAEARKRPAVGGPQHFLCDSLKIACPRKTSRARLHRKAKARVTRTAEKNPAKPEL